MNFEGKLPLENKVFDGRYRPLRLLGKGGMGEVYLVVDVMLENEQVALKVLKKSDGEEEKIHTSRFIREVKLARQVTHPNVVRTYDVGTSAEFLYFTMEYVQGVSLRDHMKQQGAMAHQDVISLFSPLCEGLHAIHALNVIHRDLKPANIMITEEGIVKITDFGIARPGTSEITHNDEIIGSSHYIAPEIWQGKEVSSATDIYALGVVLYEMLTGTLPFTANNPAELMWKHLDAEVVPPSVLQEGVPKWLDELVTALLSKDDLQRPCNALEVADYLKKQRAREEVQEIKEKFYHGEDSTNYQPRDTLDTQEFVSNIPCIESPDSDLLEEAASSITGTHSIDPQEFRAMARTSRKNSDGSRQDLLRFAFFTTLRCVAGILIMALCVYGLKEVSPVLGKPLAKAFRSFLPIRSTALAANNISSLLFVFGGLLSPLFILAGVRTEDTRASFRCIFSFLVLTTIIYGSYYITGGVADKFLQLRIEPLLSMGMFSFYSLLYGLKDELSVVELTFYLLGVITFHYSLCKMAMPKQFNCKDTRGFILSVIRSVALLAFFSCFALCVIYFMKYELSSATPVYYGTFQLHIRNVDIVSAATVWGGLCILACFFSVRDRYQPSEQL